jgi:hypothetical protein
MFYERDNKEEKKMKDNKILVIVGTAILGAVVGLALIWGLMSMSYTNRAVGLENQAKAQQEANQATYDTVWKTIKQKAQISDKYEQQFKKVYVDIMQQRQYGKGGEMMKFVMEANPQFDSSLLQSLANTIEGQRVRFETSQKMLIDIKREHDNLRQQAPGSWFVGNRPELKITIVTSAKTKEVFSVGEDNDVKVLD